MEIVVHSPRQFADGIKGLLPQGATWDWPEGGFGDALLLDTAQELARVEAETQKVLDTAIELHRPKNSSWHISQYRRVANEAIAGVAETMPRRAFAVGSTVGQRLWSQAAPDLTFPVDLVQVDHLVGPFRVGSHVGEQLWGTRSRYVLRVRYYRSVVDPLLLWEALMDFKQAHVFLWFEDITGIGGEVSYAQN